MAVFLVVLFSFVFQTPLSLFLVKNNQCQHDGKNFRCVEYVKNYDGDTITFKIAGIHPFFGKNIPVRVRGIDAPEKKTKDPCELKAARMAQKLVEIALKNAQRIDLLKVERGKYFRILADVQADGNSIKDLLLKNKLAVPYFGEKKPRINWCEYQ